MAVLCVVTACSQAFEDVSNNKKKQETTKGRLVMKVGSKSRTILPDISIVESDIKTARLTANGTEIKSWSGSGIIEQIENEDDILLDVGIYDFEMTFSNENGNVFLIGTIDNKEIKSGDNSLIFNMKLSQGNGNIAIGLSWEADCKISKIKAGLYDIATGEAVAGYEAEEIVINGTVAGYIKENVPSGQYIIKFELYDAADQLLNTLTEVIKVTVGKTTTEQKVLSNINTLYTITYNLNGGSWKSGFIPITLHNTNTEINLPTADNVEKTNYVLIGWYDENGNKVTQIPSNTAKDITMTAKWGYTANTVGAVINALSGTGPHDITVTGAITIDTISSIKTALKNNSNKRINLDLSDTTGVTSIGSSAFAGCSSLTSVTIPDSVTSIGSSAFSGCSSLTSVTIPDSVTSIGSSAFSGCDSLKSVTIPDSVTSIGKGAFSGCDNLEITINTDDKYLYSEDGTTILLCDSSVTSVIIPENVASINSGAFACCRNVETIETGDTLMSLSYLPITSALKSITIGNGVTSIGQQAFFRCSSLTSVTIGDSVTSIGNNAFNYCYSLTSVTIGDSVTSIADSVFSGCSSLTNLRVDTNNPNYSSSDDGKILYNKGKTKLIAYPSATGDVTIGNSVTSIGEYAFRECSKLTNVTIPDSVTSIGKGAFRECSKLTSVVIPDSVTSIGTSAFYECSSLTSVVIPDSVTSIDYGAFSDCSSLTNVVIPDSVTSIGSYAFSGCSSLTSVYITDLEAWCNIKFSSSLANPLDNGANLYLNGSLVTDLVIPNDVTSIGKYAFSGCSNLTNLTIPDSVTSIGEGAFSGCSSLTSVTIGNSVTSIGDYAFYKCSSLESVVIPDSVTSIGEGAFYGCSSLTSVTIGNSVTSIGEGAFRECSKLTNVTIPDSVTSIGSYAFDGCSSLTTVNYKGTQEQWKKISIRSGNTYLTNATINYNYTGE